MIVRFCSFAHNWCRCCRTFAKAWYRLAKAHIGARDFPRARRACDNGLKAATDSESLSEIRDRLLAADVGEALSDAATSEEAKKRVNESDPKCNYCLEPVPLPLTAACPHCACNPVGDKAALLHDGSL